MFEAAVYWKWTDQLDQELHAENPTEWTARISQNSGNYY
jgi:hypothetical protein